MDFSQLLFFFLLLVEMKENSLSAYPLLDFKGKANAVDELVCFQEAQTLPLFLVIPKTKPTFTRMTVKPPFNLVSQPPPSPLASSTQNASSVSSSLSTMKRAAFETLEMQELIDYLIVQGVKLEEEEIAIFKKQKITGEALIDSSVEELVSLGIPLGVAKMILKRIPK